MRDGREKININPPPIRQYFGFFSVFFPSLCATVYFSEASKQRPCAFFPHFIAALSGINAI